MFLQQIFSSLETRFNVSSKSRKSLYIKPISHPIYPPLTSNRPSQHGSSWWNWCLWLVFEPCVCGNISI